MAKSKKQKLKVFRTPIGFHDAYVAAPSQKAALEAWGTDTNLFARGTAEQVTDEDLIAVPLKRPGEVIKVLRGSKAEQIAALGKAKAQPASTPAKMRAAANENRPRPEPKAKRGPKPSRAKLAKAEEAIEAIEKKHAKELKQVDEQQRELARKRRELERRQERKREELQDKVSDERASYERALKAWEKS